jgi:hypothetical protein
VFPAACSPGGSIAPAPQKPTLYVTGTLDPAELLVASANFISEADLGVGLNFASGFRFLILTALINLLCFDSFLILTAVRESFFSTARFIFFLLGDFNRFATRFLFDKNSLNLGKYYPAVNSFFN